LKESLNEKDPMFFIRNFMFLQ